MENLCQRCGDTRLKTIFDYCNKCVKHIKSNSRKLDDGRDIRDAKQVPHAPRRKRYFTVVDSDEETSSKSSSKKNRTEDKSGVESAGETSSKKSKKDERSGCKGDSFVYSLSGFPNEYAPLIRAVWTGSFNLWYKKSLCRVRTDSFNACVSSNTSWKVRDEVAKFEPVLELDMMPRSSLWPKSFQGSGPTGDDIAVYFFSSLMKYESHYDSLVLEMIEDDLAMSVFVQDSELLIFTSIELPSQFRRFQGKLYLWGVLRGNEAPSDAV